MRVGVRGAECKCEVRCEARYPPAIAPTIEERLVAAGDGVGQRRVGRLVRQVLFAGEEADERAPLRA